MASWPGLIWRREFLQLLPDDGHRYEVIDGELLVTSPPGTRHQAVQRNLTALLVQKVQGTGRGFVFPAPTELRISETRAVVPDVMVVRAERRGVISERAIEAAPDIVIEITTA